MGPAPIVPAPCWRRLLLHHTPSPTIAHGTSASPLPVPSSQSSSEPALARDILLRLRSLPAPLFDVCRANRHHLNVNALSVPALASLLDPVAHLADALDVIRASSSASLLLKPFISAFDASLEKTLPTSVRILQLPLLMRLSDLIPAAPVAILIADTLRNYLSTPTTTPLDVALLDTLFDRACAVQHVPALAAPFIDSLIIMSRSHIHAVKLYLEQLYPHPRLDANADHPGSPRTPWLDAAVLGNAKPYLATVPRMLHVHAEEIVAIELSLRKHKVGSIDGDDFDSKFYAALSEKREKGLRIQDACAAATDAALGVYRARARHATNLAVRETGVADFLRALAAVFLQTDGRLAADFCETLFSAPPSTFTPAVAFADWMMALERGHSQGDCGAAALFKYTDVFEFKAGKVSVDYSKLPRALGAVLSNDLRTRYNEVFGALMQLRHAHYVLVRAQHRLRRSTMPDVLRRALCVLRFRMLRFVIAVEGFWHSAVIHLERSELATAIAAATSLDSIYIHHAAFVNRVIDKGLFSTPPLRHSIMLALEQAIAYDDAVLRPSLVSDDIESVLESLRTKTKEFMLNVGFMARSLIGMLAHIEAPHLSALLFSIESEDLYNV